MLFFKKKTKKPRVVHIGMPKAASTYLQYEGIRAQKGGLVNYLGFNVMADLIEDSISDASGGKLRALENSTAINNKFDIDPDLPVFISNECLFGFFPSAYRNAPIELFDANTLKKFQQNVCAKLAAILKQNFPGEEFTILIVSRSPTAWLKSLHNNFILMGVADEAQGYLSNRIDLISQLYNIDYVNEIYTGTFGADRVVWIPFEMLRDKPVEFRKYLSELLGFELSGTAPVNKGLADSSIEAIRRVNEIINIACPPAGTWNDPGHLLQLHIWNFLHNHVMNVPTNIGLVADKTIELQLDSTLPQEVVRRLVSNAKVFQTLPAYKAWTSEYDHTD